MEYKEKTKHLAMAIIDQVFFKKRIDNKDDIKLVIVASFTIAAKMELNEYKICSIKDIVNKLGNGLSLQKYLYCEKIIFSEILGY